MSKSCILLESLKCFFNEQKNADILVDILVKKSGISLRKLESFITIVSKKNNTTYTTKDGKTFVVHVAYKSSLVGYSKKLFDPFCRTERIQFPVGDQMISTTVAQLNFIKWCITHDVIEFIKSQGESTSHCKTQNQCIHNDTSV